VDLKVLIEPTLPSIVPFAIAYETGASPEEIRPDPDKFVYEHHGDEYTPESPGALTRFYEDVSLGRTLPVTFASHAIRDVDTVVAMALFLNRDLVLVPATVGFVAQVDLIHRRPVMLAHLDPHMVCFIRMLRTFLPPTKFSRSEMVSRIETAVGWIREYLTEGTFPALGRGLPEVTVLDKGTGGFVVAETMGDFTEAWVVLFSQGYVRGLLVGPEKDGRRPARAVRKSVYVSLNLELAAKLLNDVESAMGEPTQWVCHGDWLMSPPKGTLLTVPHMLEVFLRV
jgi:hypothetical protein